MDNDLNIPTDRPENESEIECPKEPVTSKQLKNSRRQKVQSNAKRQRNSANDALPISHSIMNALWRRLPQGSLRAEVEKVVGKLPKNAMLKDAIAVTMVYAAMGKFPNFKPSVVREIREAVEGRATPRTYILCPEAEEEPESMRDRVMLGIVKMMKQRQELYNLDIPVMDELERKAVEEIRKADQEL